MLFPVKVANAKAAGVVEVTSPFHGGVVGSVETLDADGVELALQTADMLFRDRNNYLPAHQRIEILSNAAKLMTERKQQLMEIAISEGGKPYRDTEVELLRAIDGVNNCIECIRNEKGTEIPMQINPASMQRLAFTHRQPIGPVVAVSAFNHPLNLIVHQVGPAIATGCPVIVKPASDTALSCFALVDIFHEAGLPEAWCQPVLTADTSVTEKLVSDSIVAFFSFIGSGRVGWMLRSKLAPGARCALEHGGVAPVIVAEDADLDNIVPLLAKGGFYHAGQVCVSVQRIYAQRAIARQLAERIAALADQMVVGDPADPATEVGPLIRNREVDRVQSWVNEAISENAEVITGAERLSEVLYKPTVLFNPSDTSKVTQQEVFGPVVCVYEYDDIEDAIDRANALPYAFQASVATQNIDTALYAFNHLNASAVMVNDHTAFRVDWMPFAGLRESGYGIGGIPYTYRDMQIEKMAVIRSPSL